LEQQGAQDQALGQNAETGHDAWTRPTRRRARARHCPWQTRSIWLRPVGGKRDGRGDGRRCRRQCAARPRGQERQQDRARPPFQREDRSKRDALLTDFGKETLDDRYLLPGETYQDLFARVADAYADDEAHAQRIYDYISKLWFMPATPVLSNGGTGRGLPISCYLNTVEDSLEGIVNTWNENVWLASRGGGIGTYWGKVRGIGESVGLNGKTSGIIPFVRVMDSLTLAISQGSLRRGSAAAISTCRTRRSRSSWKSARRRAISTARRSTCTMACC
jgi:hypothetical protein